MIPKTGNKAADTIIAFALVILVVYVLKRVINLIRSVTPDEDTTKPERDPNVNPLPVDKTKLTYPESQYDLFADELDALFTSSVTEDEAAIKNVFYNLRTDSDFAALVNKFGVRDNFLSGQGNLYYYVSKFLSKKDVKDLNTHFWRFSIKYRF